MKIAYFALCFALLALSVAGTWWVQRPQGLPDAPVTRYARPAPRPPSIPDAPNLPDRPVSGQSVKELIAHDLFRPSRAPRGVEPAAAKDGETVEEAPPAETYELVGIAKIGEEACASIRVSVAASRGQRQKTAGGEQRLYSLGEAVGHTGYVLGSVTIDTAVLTSDAGDLTLRIDPTSAESKKRQTAKSAGKPAATAPTVRIVTDSPQPPTAATAPQPPRAPRGAASTPPPHAAAATVAPSTPLISSPPMDTPPPSETVPPR